MVRSVRCTKNFFVRSSAAYTAAGGHLVTSFYLTHKRTVVFNIQRFHSVPIFFPEVSICRYMNVGQYTDLMFVHPTHSPQVPSYRGYYIIFLLLQVLCPETGWHVLPVVVDCITVIYFLLIKATKLCWEGKIIVCIQFVAQSLHFSDKLQHCVMCVHGIGGRKFCF